MALTQLGGTVTKVSAVRMMNRAIICRCKTKGCNHMWEHLASLYDVANQIDMSSVFCGKCQASDFDKPFVDFCDYQEVKIQEAASKVSRAVRRHGEGASSAFRGALDDARASLAYLICSRLPCSPPQRMRRRNPRSYFSFTALALLPSLQRSQTHLLVCAVGSSSRPTSFPIS